MGGGVTCIKNYKYVVDVVPRDNLYSTKHVFSCVPSDGRVGRMHSNTDYIRLILLHCVFSNVSSNCLPQRMQNYTGGICWTFLHYGLSYVSSKNLDQSHTGCICFVFLHCGFSKFPQIACPRRCKVTLFAFVRPLSPVGFHMSPQIGCIIACIVTPVAFILLFSAVVCQMCPQMACL